MKHQFSRMVAVLTTCSLLTPPLAARAAVTTYAIDKALTVNGVELVIKQGSVAESIEVTATDIKVTVPEGEAFELRTAYPSRNVITSGGKFPNCNVQSDKTNRVFVSGPDTVMLSPSNLQCDSDSSSYKKAPDFEFGDIPSAMSGQETLFTWGTGGSIAHAVTLRLSVDDGATFPIVLAADLVNNGFYKWQVPSMPSASKARLKLEAKELGRITAFGVSEPFGIIGTSPEPAAPGNGGITIEPYDYDVDHETREAATIGVDKGLVANPATQICQPDMRIKTASSSAVYYCAVDGKRYVFPNFNTYRSWYGDDFNGVVTLEEATMQKIPLGGNVTYRPGTRMLKLQTAPDVFAVAADGTLRYVTEAVAVRLYGPEWNKMIDDLPDTFFVDYKVGEPVKE